ncbi:cell death activator CIDE-3-like [Xenia sp. Carnegie-2017]|uniref:cell death activator CIDE-3-like n=1 Tax=Xenia sp. Carnegie-2017 TaxID=2897299 RepID=UPI001F049977|nr:cell death activator CIDE-3-like [Xenia sp. Carnegie-2017]
MDDNNYDDNEITEMDCKDLATESKPNRPFKICSMSRDNRKGIVCSSLEELKCLSRSRLGLNEDCRVYLECDGTEVDSEEYFQFLPPQTLFLVANSNEHWEPGDSNSGKKLDNGRITESQESYSGTDKVDGPVRLSSSLQQRILKDPLFFVSMSTEDLELISEFGMENLPNQMNISMDRARLIYDNCELNCPEELT